MHYQETRRSSLFRSDHLNNRPMVFPATSTILAPHWYALHTRSRDEKVVDRLLRHSGFRTFLPLIVKRSRLSLRRMREAELPLFPGYTFAQFAPSREHLRVVRSSAGGAGLLGSNSGPAFILDAASRRVNMGPSNHVAWFPRARVAG